MVSGRVLPRKRRLQEPIQEGSSIRRRPPTRQAGDRFGLTMLQQQVGNRAVQQLLAQRQAAKQDETAKEPVDAGLLKIEKPKIEEYAVQGNNLTTVSEQVLPPGKWYEYEYQYNPKVENGLVKQVDITIIPTIYLPRWEGPGWEDASAAEKTAWLEMLKTMMGDPDKYENMLQLPRQWVGLDLEQAPPPLKGPWQGMLQEMQSQEKSYMDTLRRRASVLQQKMLNQPVEQLKTIFDLFNEGVKVEDAAYGQLRELGKDQQVALSTDEMVH